jgi:hypothetical protein
VRVADPGHGRAAAGVGRDLGTVADEHEHGDVHGREAEHAAELQQLPAAPVGACLPRSGISRSARLGLLFTSAAQPICVPCSPASPHRRRRNHDQNHLGSEGSDREKIKPITWVRRVSNSRATSSIRAVSAGRFGA